MSVSGEHDSVPETGTGAGVAAEARNGLGSSAPPRITVVRGNPSPQELAAVTAVIAGVVEELATVHRREPAPTTDAWAAAQRPLRAPIIPGITQWRQFS